MKKWLAVAALVGLAVYLTARPKWLDDVLIRCYSKDYLVDGQSNPKAADVAAEYGIPTKWAVHLQENGVPDEELDERTGAIIDLMVSWGPPKNTTPEELQRYRDQILGAALAAGSKP